MRLFLVREAEGDILLAAGDKKDLLEVAVLEASAVEVGGDKSAMKKIRVGKVYVSKLRPVEVRLNDPGSPKRTIDNSRRRKDTIPQFRI